MIIPPKVRAERAVEYVLKNFEEDISFAVNRDMYTRLKRVEDFIWLYTPFTLVVFPVDYGDKEGVLRLFRTNLKKKKLII